MVNIASESTASVLYKNSLFSASYQDGEGTTEPYIAESNACNDENDYDYEPPDPDTIPEKFEISPIKICITKTKVENLAPRSLPKVQQKYKQEKKRLKSSLAETFAPGQGTELI